MTNEPTLHGRPASRSPRSARSALMACCPAEETTPNRSPCEVEEVTIIDPRHALHGQTLRLVKIHRSGKARATCTVELQKDVWRRIPVSVTDCGRHEPVVYPLPLNLVVVGQLLDLVKRMAAIAQEESNHEDGADEFASAASSPGCPTSDNTQPGLESTRAKSPTAGADVSDSDMPADSEDKPSTAGGEA